MKAITITAIAVCAITVGILMTAIDGYHCNIMVIDGDTVSSEGERIRIAGIDTPEMNHGQPEKGAIEAKQVARKLLEDDCRLFIKGKSMTTGDGRGKYGRIIGDFWLEEYSMTFGEYMLTHGYAEPF